MQTFEIEDFAQWRDTARRLLAAGMAPSGANFRQAGAQQDLFAGTAPQNSPGIQTEVAAQFNVPGSFLHLAKQVAFHRDETRWNLLYRVLWRLVKGEPALLQISTDDDVLALHTMEKQVRRDAHKMKAFVRFRQVTQNGQDHFIAWHRPDHRIVRKVAPFFARRFRKMNWTIITPAESVMWDQSELHYGPGAPRSVAPQSDELKDLWLTYYRSIFNPARVKVKMMKSEMPVRHWPTLPETVLIPELLAAAGDREKQMVASSEGYESTAGDYIAAAARPVETLSQLADLAAGCTACDLHQAATQTVPGRGSADAPLVLTGEQPGDLEDLAGQPFVGPAGEILRSAMQAAGMTDEAVYMTNIVKHFKHQTTSTPRGKRRLHQRPNAREIRCCKPWFDAEWALLSRPEVLVCLGATAAQTLIGPEFRISQNRGQWIESSYCPRTIATWHPSAVLRAGGDAAKEQKRRELVDDLATALAAIEK